MKTYETDPKAVVRAIAKGVDQVLDGAEFTIDPAIGTVENKDGDFDQSTPQLRADIGSASPATPDTQLATRAVAECLRRSGVEFETVSDEQAMHMAVTSGAATELATTGGKVYGWEQHHSHAQKLPGMEARRRRPQLCPPARRSFMRPSVSQKLVFERSQ